MKKTSFVLTFLLILCFSSAAWAASTGTRLYVDGTNNPDNDHYLNIESAIFHANDKASADSAYKSFAITVSIAAAIDNKVLIDSEFTNLEKITIEGNVSLNNVSSQRHFSISNSSIAVEIKNLTLNGAGGGVEISDGAKVSFDSVTFNSNSASNGGAVYINGSASTAAFEDCTFTSNTATNGGAVYVNAGTATLNGNTFTGNSATSGGAVYVSNGTLNIIDNNTFENNTATSDGGAIYSTGSTLNTTGTVNTFTNNSATTGSGGVFYLNSGTLTVSSDNFSFATDNTATNGGIFYVGTSATLNVAGNFTFSSYSANNGGLIYSAGTVNFSGEPTFSYNSASTGSGGVIYSTGSLNFVGSADFTSNTAASEGGAIYSTGSVTFENAGSFSSNTATSNGGAIYSGGSLTFESTAEFNANKSSSNGGAIYSANALVFDGAGTFYANVASSDGGAIYSNGSLTLTASETSFMNNEAENNGGAVYVAGSAATFTGVTFGDSNGSTNNAALNGGAVYIAGGSASITSSDFYYNAADEYGGAVYAGSTLNLGKDVNFTHNESGLGGGAIFAEHSSHIKNASSTTVNFSENETDGDGGALYILAGTNFSLSNSSGYVFAGNFASNDGGAIYTLSADVNLTNLTITGTAYTNTATRGGGGFVRAGGNITVTNSSISNQRGAYGGAISGIGAITVTSADFSNNSATGCTDNYRGGGAIYSGTSITIENSTFTANTGTGTSSYTGGGAIYAEGGLNVTNSTFTNNVHTRNSGSANGAGAIYGNTGSGSNIIFENNIFTENRAIGDSVSGGAIYLTGNANSVAFTNCYFGRNRTRLDSNGGNGGALFLSMSAVNAFTIDDSTFYYNQSGGRGGAIDARVHNIAVRTSYFHDNTSMTGGGGAIYYDEHSNSPSFYLYDTAFVHNTTNGDNGGGAVFLYPYNAEIQRCTFDSNICLNNTNAKGGALSVRPAGSTLINNCTFAANTATGNGTNQGGALYVNGNTSLKSSTLTLTNLALGENGQGGAVFVNTGVTLTMTSTIAVGNQAQTGSDIYADGTVSTAGFNRVGVFGTGGYNSEWSAVEGNKDNDSWSEDWKTETFFGDTAELADNALSDTIPPYVGATCSGDRIRIQTVKLSEDINLALKSRATDAIPNVNATLFDNTDQRGSTRPMPKNGQLDIGAYEEYQSSSSGTDDNPSSNYIIQSIKMSGVPNTMKTLGQTASLIALITYTNGTTNYGGSASDGFEEVVWESNRPTLLHVDQKGNIVALGTGTVTLSVSTKRAGAGGSILKDSHIVNVTLDDYTNLNVSPEFVRQLGNYLYSLLDYDMSLMLPDLSSAVVNTSTFQQNFKNIWNVSQVAQVTDLTKSSPSFTTATNYNSSDGSTAVKKAGVNINFKDRSNGDLFPLTFAWNFSGSEVKDLLGSDLSNTEINSAFAEKLFNVLKIDFQGTNGIGNIMSAGGVSAADAMSNGSLKLTKADSNKGLHVEFTAYLANVSSSSSAFVVSDTSANDGPQFVKSAGNTYLLIVPDGSDDGAIFGTVWLAKKGSTSSSKTNGGTNNSTSAGNNNEEGGSGGGGGCDTINAGIFAAAVLAFCISKRR